MPHAALWVVQLVGVVTAIMAILCFNAARGFVGGAAFIRVFDWFSQESFNAARGFVGGAATFGDKTSFTPLTFQCRTRLCGWCSLGRLLRSLRALMVSMPHAALWVVQPSSVTLSLLILGFQCRTRLCGWCSLIAISDLERKTMFQCRTRLCGWCNRIARSPCPPRGKKPFWKVSGNLSVLTENMQNICSYSAALSGAIPCAIST